MNIEKTNQIKNDTKLAALSVVGIVFLIFITNPTRMPIVFVLLIPALISFFTFVFSRLMLRVFFNIGDHQLRVLSYAVAGSVLFVLLLGSLKQLGLQDFVLSALLAGGLAFYFLRSATDSTSA